ncbi:MAG: pseudouridine synthase [Evtepia gabavorous]
MLHKPAGLLSATEDRDQRTVLDLLPEHLRRRGLFPVGRLDKDTEGYSCSLMTVRWAHSFLSPKRHVDKVYLARVDGVVDQSDVEALARGMVLGDGLHACPRALAPGWSRSGRSAWSLCGRESTTR